jgi:hypothetical protein
MELTLSPLRKANRAMETLHNCAATDPILKKYLTDRDRAQEIRDKICRETFVEETLNRTGYQVIR